MVHVIVGDDCILRGVVPRMDRCKKVPPNIVNHYFNVLQKLHSIAEKRSIFQVIQSDHFGLYLEAT